jgi:glyceraldehyde 3-phosphate dehydrogenase
MKIKIAINGFGRIGRNITRALYESGYQKDFELVAINDLGDLSSNAHLLKYDSVHGRFRGEVGVEGNDLMINGDKIRVCAERNPVDLPWKSLGIDIVFECTGLFASKKQAAMHLEAGANKVLISAPAGDDVLTVVYGVNHQSITAADKIVSNASCTTNCLAPIVKVLHQKAKILRGFMTTVHAYTNDQSLTDSYHKDLRRARAAAQSMIPAKTGAAAAVGLVLPELKGKLDGYAIRVPTINVSIVDFTCDLERKTTAEEIDQWMHEAAKGELKGVLDYTDEQLVSIDFNHNPASSTFDATQTRVIDNMVKVVSWYDNEWGFSNRMLDTAKVMGR